jgi:hypothetical protein
LPVPVKTVAAEIEMMPSIKKTYGGLRSVLKLGINNAIPFLAPSMKDYTGLSFSVGSWRKISITLIEGF